MTSDLDYLAQTVLGFAADAAVRSLVVAGVIGAAMFALRGRGAALQLKGWTMLLWAALALPALGAIVPAWQWRVLTDRVQLVLSSAGPSATQSAGAIAATASPATDAGAGPSFLVIAAALYAAGVLLLLGRAALGWFATRQLRLDARVVEDANAIAALARHTAAAKLAMSPRLLESDHLFVPITTSVVDPVVILPADFREWPDGRLDAVLAHELSHVGRKDALAQRASLVYRAALWFSPLSWWLHRHIANLSEQASDEAALQAGVSPMTYAETLLDCFRRLQHQPRRASWHLAMARRADDNAAERRVERILTWDGSRISARPAVWLAIIVVVAASAAGVTASVRFASVKASPVTLPALPATAVSADAVKPNPLPAPLTAPAPAEKTPSTETTRAAKARVPASPPANARPQSLEPAPVAAQPQTGTPVSSTLSAEEFGAGSYRPGAGVSWPVDITQVKPKYTSEGMRAKIQGTVDIEIIVMPDGTVGQARLIKSLDQNLYGLDEAALIAARQWRFKPGRLNNEAVPVRVEMSLEFRLH